jgi:hypothetical protein
VLPSKVALAAEAYVNEVFHAITSRANHTPPSAPNANARRFNGGRSVRCRTNGSNNTAVEIATRMSRKSRPADAST